MNNEYTVDSVLERWLINVTEATDITVVSTMEEVHCTTIPPSFRCGIYTRDLLVYNLDR